MIHRSSIYMMHPAKHAPGFCSVCGEPAQLKFIDSANNAMLGDCCKGEMIRAEALLHKMSLQPIKKTSFRK